MLFFTDLNTSNAREARTVVLAKDIQTSIYRIVNESS